MRSILITGGTGSLGRAVVRDLLRRPETAWIGVYSRDEWKQWEMRRSLGDDARVRFLIGDVRDRDRLRRAMWHGGEAVEAVIHAAALKQVPACEYNVGEAIKTNVTGSQNVVEAAIDAGVGKALIVSSDKACAPVTLYGATKLCAERIFLHGNSYAGRSKTRIGAVRYGNVIGSRGSVVHLWAEEAKRGWISITDPTSTRFWITLPQAAAFVLRSLEVLRGGEVWIPKLPTGTVADLASAVVSESVQRRITGLRAGEKRHEVLISPDEADQAVDAGSAGYVLLSSWAREAWADAWIASGGATPVPPGFWYGSDGTLRDHPRLSPKKLRSLLGDSIKAEG